MKRFIIVPLMLAFAISALGQSSKLTVGIESTTTITSVSRSIGALGSAKFSTSSKINIGLRPK